MVKRILLGAFTEGGGKFGLRVSQAGYDVATNPVDNEKLVFNSDWPEVLPIYQTGSIAVPANTSTVVNYPTLGYVPHATMLVNKGANLYQHYVTSNTLYVNRANGVTRKLLAYPVGEFASDGGFYSAVILRSFTDRLVLYSSFATTIVYTVYRVRAF